MNMNAIDLQTENQQLKLEVEEQQQKLEQDALRANYENYLVSQVLEHAARRNHEDLANVEHAHRSCGYFDGDLFLTSRNADGGVYALLGDFGGQGFAAAIGAMPVSEIFFSMVAKSLSVGEMVTEMNATLHRLLPENMNFSATVIEAQGKGDRVNLWSGGMEDVLLCEPAKGSSRRLSSGHAPLGSVAPEDFDANYSRLYCRRGDSFLVYSNGLVNARNPEGDLFGGDRLQSMFERDAQSLDVVMGTFDSFVANEDQNDDISAALIRCGEA